MAAFLARKYCVQESSTLLLNVTVSRSPGLRTNTFYRPLRLSPVSEAPVPSVKCLRRDLFFRGLLLPLVAPLPADVCAPHQSLFVLSLLADDLHQEVLSAFGLLHLQTHKLVTVSMNWSLKHHTRVTIWAWWGSLKHTWGDRDNTRLWWNIRFKHQPLSRGGINI